jgi:murein L,D-transpeptidase YafK
MIEIIKRWILFKLKSFQFQVRTIKNSYEISKAYASNRGSKKIHYRKLMTTVVLLIVGIGLMGAIAYGTVIFMHSDIIKNFQKTFFIKKEPGRIDKSSVMDFGVKKEKSIQAITDVKATQSDTSNRLQGSMFAADSVDSLSYDTNGTTPVVLIPPTVDSSLYTFDSGAHPVSDDSSDYMILVANKALHTMFVLQKDPKKNWKTVRTYFVAIGAQQGQKINAGDKRTPEGMYLVIERKERYQLSSIYGPLAYVLDYPNAIDLAAGRTGQGIWIHGTSYDTIPFETKGCLEMNNTELSELSTFLKSGKATPIFIINDSLQKNPLKAIDTAQITLRRQEYFNSLKVVADTIFVRFMTDWQDAWESRDIDRYSNYYFQTRFSTQGMNWDGWKEKKIKTFQLYDTINVTYSKLAVSDTTDSTAVLRFSQVYQTEKVRFQNNKQLNLEKEQGMWKITREAAF